MQYQVVNLKKELKNPALNPPLIFPGGEKPKALKRAFSFSEDRVKMMKGQTFKSVEKGNKL
jgi:hypothetical protein